MGRANVYARCAVIACALNLAGCALPRHEVRPNDPLEVIPANWIDLRGAPFVARIVGPKAILLNQTKSSFKEVDVGYVRQEVATTRVVASLFGQSILDSAWRPGGHVEGLLRMVNNIDFYIATQMKYIGRDILKRCSEDSRIAVIKAVSVDGREWSADGTLWKAKNTR